MDDAKDTPQGPTPEIRETMRATDDDPAAAGQPEANRDTRADVTGNQDEERTRPVDPDVRDRPAGQPATSRSPGPRCARPRR